jgi:hypothetical protein
MRSIILTLFFILFLNDLVSAQTTFIYVDVSGNLDRDLLKGELESKSQTIGELTYFISNDNTPVIGNTSSKLKNELKDLSTLKPSTPISYREVDTILSVLDVMQPPITLMFYFDYQYARSGGLQNLVERLLLSNGWMDKVGLKKGITVKLNFQKQENITDQQQWELSKNGKYEIIIY